MRQEVQDWLKTFGMNTNQMAYKWGLGEDIVIKASEEEYDNKSAVKDISTGWAIKARAENLYKRKISGENIELDEIYSKNTFLKSCMIGLLASNILLLTCLFILLYYGARLWPIQ